MTLSEQESRVLSIVKKHPLASQKQLADMLNLTRESVAGHLMRLSQKGHILGKGYLFPEQSNIVAIGGCNLDITASCIKPLCPNDSNPGHMQRGAGGVARNMAENLVRLGHQVSLLSALGADESGDWLFAHNQHIGINMTHSIRSTKHNTGTYLAINSPDGNLHCAVADMEIISDINTSLLTQKQALLRSASLLLVEANLDEASIAWLAQQKLSSPIYADGVSASKVTRLLPLLSQLTTLKVNREEAITLLKQASNTCCQTLNDHELTQGLLKLGVQHILLSLGAEGVLFASQKDQRLQAGFPTQSINDTGAGDALFSGFIHTQLKQWPLKEALIFANACAAKTLSSEEANDPTLTQETVTQWITDHPL